MGTKQLCMLESDARPLGMLVDLLGPQDFEISQSEWGKGDAFILYSDGITEAENENGEPFGEERLERSIAENIHLPPDQLKETVLNELDNFCHGKAHMDDVSLVAIKMGM